MITNDCPVCKQVGIPDYKIQHVICPQCNSDLVPYILLNSIAKKKSNGKLNVFITFILAICCIFFGVMFFSSSHKNTQMIVKKNESIKSLQDSIIVLKDKALTLNKASEEISNNGNASVLYTVKEGDYLWKIADFFYNEGSKYREIEKDNNLVAPYSLKIGQKLIIILNH